MSEQHAHVLYTKLLLSRGHGYPLWIPEPDYSLCPAYVGKGICVGDVGIIRDDGGFDFIFNAFLEADDPVHEGGVPPNFSPLRIESPNPIRTIYYQHPRDSSVRSSHLSVKSVNMEASAEVPSIAGGGAGFEFTASKDQAAVLMLPQGGTRYDHKYLLPMRNYALEHAHEWYEYINSPDYLGREALNGSLCFITGCDKTAAWGSAVMSKPSDIREFSIKFLLGGFSGGRILLRSSWSTQEWTDTRIYPGQDIDMNATPSLPTVENQGVFIRSFTISVREKNRISKILPGFGRRPGGVLLMDISGKSGKSPAIGSKAPYSDQRQDSPPVSAPAWSGNGGTVCGSIEGNELMRLQTSSINTHMKSFGGSHEPDSISDYPLMSSIPYGGANTTVASQLSSDEHDHVVLRYLPERSIELLNPSVKFNEYILSTVPESDVVVTHDSVWMLPMLEKGSGDDSLHLNILNPNEGHNTSKSTVAQINQSSTPPYNTVDSLRTPSESTGGCWTCRLRQKKCDQKREGNSCHTCVRLNIECMGWGPKRPEWMHDKEAVNAYRENLKAHFIRSGLTRSSIQRGPVAQSVLTHHPRTRALFAPSPKTFEKSPSTASSSLAMDVNLPLASDSVNS